MLFSTYGRTKGHHLPEDGTKFYEIPQNGCDRAIPKVPRNGIAMVGGYKRERMGLIARGTFGAMVEMFNRHYATLREPLRDPSYANQGPVDNDI
jgi:hypothetical protein